MLPLSIAHLRSRIMIVEDWSDEIEVIDLD